MTTYPKLFLRFVEMALAALALNPDLASAQVHKPPKAPKSVRLYIFDCGVIHSTNGDAYSLKKKRWPRPKCPSPASWSRIRRGR
jgi:hypothetical protein